jgi:hypothetical protein
MINHVIFEGYLMRTWEFRGNHFLRQACHQCPKNGTLSTFGTSTPVCPEPGVAHWTKFCTETGGKMSFDDAIAPVGHDDQLERGERWIQSMSLKQKAASRS